MIKRIKDFIVSEEGIMLWAAMALLVMVSHTTTVFLSHEKQKTWLAIAGSLLYAISIDAAILVFVLLGRRYLSLMFGIFQVLINLFYYYNNLNEYAPLFLAPAIPIAIAAYAHEVLAYKKVKDIKDKEDILEVKVKKHFDTLTTEVRNNWESVEEITGGLRASIDAIKDTINEVDLSSSVEYTEALSKVETDLNLLNSKVKDLCSIEDITKVYSEHKELLSLVDKLHKALLKEKEYNPSLKHLEL